MIANIGRGENLVGVLTYNNQKVDKENGQILFTNNMIETPDGNYSVRQLARSFETYLLANNKTEKPVLHISLNPDPKDEVSDEQFRDIAQDYMGQMGYGNQPYVVFKHNDIDRVHIHIVSVCIDEKGKKISDTFEKRRSVNISRALEQKYGLVPVLEKDSHLYKSNFTPVDYKKGNIKSQIASVIRYLPKLYRCQSLGEYNALLSLFNIKSEEVKGELQGVNKQGLVYFALNEQGEKISNPFKASLFGKQAGYLLLLEHFEKCREDIKELSQSLLKNKIDIAMHSTLNEAGFKKQLEDKGISTVVRRNGEGRIYGITFIDHNSKMVINGSRLGKAFSANEFNGRWSHDQKKESNMPKDVSTSVPHMHEPNNLFDFPRKNEPHETSLIDGLGSLLPTIDGDDYEEQLFENLVKKKKKRGQNRSDK